MGISEEIKQKQFESEYSKSIINILYSSAWVNTKHQSLFKTHGLTTPQFNILRILRGQHPQPATVNLLIERMLDKSSNASRIVDKLEQKGLVIRKQCKDDRRAVDVLISDKGMQLLHVLDEQVETLNKKISNLSEEECKTLNGLLDKMRS